MIHQLFAPVLIVVILFSIVIRVLTAPFRMGRWHRRHYWGHDYGYHRSVGRPLLTILGLIVLERLFGRRYY